MNEELPSRLNLISTPLRSLSNTSMIGLTKGRRGEYAQGPGDSPLGFGKALAVVEAKGA
jgi:hypothetical protein